MDIEPQRPRTKALPGDAEASLSRLPCGICRADGTWVVRSTNAAWVRLLDLPPQLGERGSRLRDALEWMLRRGDQPRDLPASIPEIERHLVAGAALRMDRHASAVELQAQRGVGGGVDVIALDATSALLAERASEDLRAELRRLRAAQQDDQEALRHARKMEAIGQLTGGLAHDFNNLLTVLIGSLEILRAGVEVEPMREVADGALRAAERGAEVSRRLLAFSRSQPLQPRSVDIARLLGDVEVLLRHTLPENIQVECRALEAGLHCRVDPAQLENGLLNLAVNSRDAMPQGGRLAIVASPGTADGAGDGEQVELTISDDGEGMSDDVRQRAVEPFFTTKEAGQGTGLGLSMVYGFINQSGGRFRIESEPGAGTVVRLSLPADRPSTEAAGETAGPPSRAAREGLRILLTEDDPDVREILVSMLEGLGHAVDAVSDYESAVERLGAGDRVDLLVSDIGLAGARNGYHLARLAGELLPEVKILLVSGYQRRRRPRKDAGPLDAIPVLQKPFGRDELSAKLAELFSG